MVNKWELYGKVKASSYRKRVLKAIIGSPKTPTELSKVLDINMSHISRTLSELLNMGLIESAAPGLRKGRIYRVTRLGKDINRSLD